MAFLHELLVEEAGFTVHKLRKASVRFLVLFCPELNTQVGTERGPSTAILIAIPVGKKETCLTAAASTYAFVSIIPYL